MTRSRTETREKILSAAEDLVIRDGVSKLTLEGAAHAAGVSKGGVLYHFPSRAALVSAMVQRFVEGFDDDLAAYGALEGRPGDFTRAYLLSTVEPSTEPGDPRSRRLGGCLLAGVASDPDLLAPLRDRFAAWQEAVSSDGLPAEVATVVRLTADGLWLGDLFGLAPVTGELRAAVRDRLLALVDEAVAARGEEPALSGSPR